MNTYNEDFNVTNDLGLALMHVVARRIARLRKTDKAAAIKDQQQAISSMTPDEIEEFARTIIRYAIEIG